MPLPRTLRVPIDRRRRDPGHPERSRGERAGRARAVDEEEGQKRGTKAPLDVRQGAPSTLSLFAQKKRGSGARKSEMGGERCEQLPESWGRPADAAPIRVSARIENFISFI